MLASLSWSVTDLSVLVIDAKINVSSCDLAKYIRSWSVNTETKSLFTLSVLVIFQQYLLNAALVLARVLDYYQMQFKLLRNATLYYRTLIWISEVTQMENGFEKKTY